MKEKILIIGAGACGLMAADSLAERRYDVTVVEARHRIGGRIDTLENYFSIPVERGAEFIHGRQTGYLIPSSTFQQQRQTAFGKPLSVIRFSPALSDHARAFDQMAFGGVIKLFFEFNQAFREDNPRRPVAQKIAF